MKIVIVVLSFLLTSSPVHARSDQDEMKNVLMLTHSAGFCHSVVKRPEPDTLSHAERCLIEAANERFNVTATQDCGQITADNLADYDAVVFYTTGELPISEANRDAFFDWIRSGGAFIGVHSATDTWYNVPEYGEMIGGYFDGHPWHQEVGILVEDSNHPATKHLDRRFLITDEIYQHRDFHRNPVRVLMRLDPASVEIEKGKRADHDYGMAWCRDYGEGRVFYAALGHREEVWEDPRFMNHLLGAIDWAINGPDYAPPAPDGAVVLFDGKDLSQWQTTDGDAAGWTIIDGAMEVKPGAGSIASRRGFGDCLLHIEFMTPRLPDDVTGQARGNSGVYLQTHYEVQVLDSYGIAPGLEVCGAIYGVKAPNVNASRPPERWQSYDIQFRAPRFDASGQKTGSASMTVWHNGLLIHRDVEVGESTRASLDTPEAASAPIMLQDHGCRVRYRNIWVMPAKER